MKTKAQRGNVIWLLLALIICFVIGGWQFKEYKGRQRAAAEQARVAAEKLAREEAERKVEQERVARESAALKAVDAVVVRWNDANKVAGATSRIALSGPVSTLQSIKREADGLTMPECLESGGSDLVKSMDATVQGYVTFMRNELSLGSTLAQSSFEDAAKSMQKFEVSRANCRA